MASASFGRKCVNSERLSWDLVAPIKSSPSGPSAWQCRRRGPHRKSLPPNAGATASLSLGDWTIAVLIRGARA